MPNKEYPYLYLGSVTEARRYNELDRWRDSHKLNIACKEAIEASIRKGFDGMNLDTGCAKEMIEAYGFKRVEWVLANTIQQKKEDGRFSHDNKAWAAPKFIPKSDRNYEFMVDSHPAVLDGFVTQFRKELEQLQLFDRSHCESMTGADLVGKVLVMSPVTLKESYWSQENQLWLATGGFGCSPTAAGRAVYATCLGDGEHTRWDRCDFIGILRKEHLPEWAKEKLEQMIAQKESAPIEGEMVMR